VSLRRHIDFKVIMLNGMRIRRRAIAPPKRQFSDKGVDQMLVAAAAQLEKDYPDRAFRLAPLRGSAFNFIEIPRTEGLPTADEWREMGKAKAAAE
jgi:hypothetical protein